MNYFEKNRIYIFIIIILLIFNISAITAIIFHIRAERHPAMERRTEEGRRGFHLTDSLGFNQEQKVAFDTLRAQFGRNTRTIMKKIEEQKHEMMFELTSDHPDTARLASIAREMGTLHVQQKLLTIDHFTRIRQLCTPDQLLKFNALFRKILLFEQNGQPRGGKQAHHGESWDNRPYFSDEMPF